MHPVKLADDKTLTLTCGSLGHVNEDQQIQRIVDPNESKNKLTFEEVHIGLVPSDKLDYRVLKMFRILYARRRTSWPWWLTFDSIEKKNLMISS